jgi:ferredoxin-type protein NapH
MKINQNEFVTLLWKYLKTVLICIPFILLSYILMSQGKPIRGNLYFVSFYAVFIGVNVLFFLMLLSGKTYRYRKYFFVPYAFLFAIMFMTNMVEMRGSIVVTQSNMISGETPFCHMVIPMMLVPAVINKTIIFPGSLLNGWASIAAMFVIWIGAAIALGRAWCSWACFYGGFDEGFSSIKKKAVVRISRKWILLPFGILIAVALVSAATLSPVYCDWLCPFKAVTEFEEIISFKTLVAAVIFYLIFVFFVIVLPILSGKRTQCALFCPFGAFQSLTNKINIFEIRADLSKCIKCGKCIRICPTMSIDEESLSKGKATITCTKCGRCIDECPSGALSYHIKGTPIGMRMNLSRVLFLYTAFLFAAVIGSGFMTKGVYRILMFATTGSFF